MSSWYLYQLLGKYRKVYWGPPYFCMYLRMIQFPEMERFFIKYHD